MKPILLCLHGWGGSKESFAELRAALEGANVEILTPDLPGFGDEPEPPHAWTVDEYADWVARWLAQRLRISDGGLREYQERKIFLLGHSHGGRIAIVLASRLNPAIRPPAGRAGNSQSAIFPIAHLFLCASAGIRHPRHFKRILGLVLSKSGKFFLSIPLLRHLQPIAKKLLYKLVRVHDYEKASPVMRDTMIKVTAQDLTPLLSTVSLPVSIFWGEADRMTPVGDAATMHRLLRGSELTVFPGVRHNVHRFKAEEIAEAIRRHL